MGVIITVVLLKKNVKGALLVGILSTYVLGIVAELIGWYVPNPEMGVYSLLPSAPLVSLPPSLKEVTFKFAPFQRFLQILIRF